MEVLILTNRLDKQHGGLTASLLKKAKILKDLKEINSKILTFHLDASFIDAKKDIRNRYRLPEDIEIYNINNYYRRRNCNGAHLKFTIDLHDYIKVSINQNTEDYYSHGKRFYRCTKINGQIRGIMYYSETGEFYKRITIDSEGFLHHCSYYINGKLSRQILYRLDQTVYLTREFDLTVKKEKISSIILFDNEKPIRFTSFNAYKQYFIEVFIKSKPTYLIVEERSLDPVVVNMNDENIRKIFMTHSVHIRPGTNIIRTGNRPVLKNLNNIDALVLLTEKQRRAIAKRFGERTNYYVIPHSIKEKNIIVKKVENRVVFISRLHEEKRIEDAIYAFVQVRQKIKDAELHIYGSGPMKEQLQELIKSLGLNEVVVLKGYANKIDEIFQSAECSLLTSKYEGFGMVILESLANGTPVISYDINYGPSDMIIDGENGYLVEDENVNQLATKIINLLQKSRLEKRKMSARALEISRDFSDEVFANNWLELIENVEEAEEGYDAEVKLLEVKKLMFNKYFISINVKLNAKSLRKPEFEALFYRRSTLQGMKEEEHVSFPIKATATSFNEYTIEVVFDRKTIKKNDVYDMFLEIKEESNYLKIRVGNNRNDIELKDIGTRKCVPYYTKDYHNLSFKVL